jgi:hypothetical protein
MKADLPPSLQILLAAHQAGHDFSNMGDISGIIARVTTGTIEIDTSPRAIRAVLRAMQEADDRRAGVMRLWVDDLVQPDASDCMG